MDTVREACALFYRWEAPTLTDRHRDEFVDAVNSTWDMLDAVDGAIDATRWAHQLDVTHSVPQPSGRRTPQDAWAVVVEHLVERWHDARVKTCAQEAQDAPTLDAKLQAQHRAVHVAQARLEASQARLTSALDRYARIFD